jgi:hypothetical protein
MIITAFIVVALLGRGNILDLIPIKMLTTDELRKREAQMSQEAPMSHFVVSFMKDVLGDNGRQAEICQKILEIDAPTEGEATEIAKQRFCKAERLCEWSLHADRIQVKSADFSL